MTLHRQQIVRRKVTRELVMAGRPLALCEIAYRVGERRTVVSVVLHQMEREGILSADGEDRGVRYAYVAEPTLMGQRIVHILRTEGPQTTYQIAEAIYGDTTSRSMRNAYCRLDKLRMDGHIRIAGRVACVNTWEATA